MHDIGIAGWAADVKISAAEFQRNIGQDVALTQSAAVTRNRRERRKRRDRQVLQPEDFTDHDLAALEETRAPQSTKAFDSERRSSRVAAARADQ
jgi:hypothetical protein